MLSDDSPRSLFFVYGHSGYFDVFTNAGTWLAAQVPIARAPLVTVWLSFGVIASLLWVTLYWSSTLLPSIGARITAAVLLIVGTLAMPEAWLNTLEAQVYLALLAVLLLFVELRRLSRIQFVFGAIVLAVAGLSGVYADLLAPFFIWRAVKERTRRSIVYAAVSGVSAAIQLAVVVHLRFSGQTGGSKLGIHRPGTIARDIASYHVVGFVSGPVNAGTLHSHAQSFFGFGALAGGALVVIAVLGVLLARAADRRIALVLAGVFLIEELGVNIGAGFATGRFAVVPIGILILMLVHLTFTGRNGLQIIGVGMCAVVFVFGLSTFWTYQPSNLRCRGCPDWAQEVQRWHDGASTRLDIWPYPTWYIAVPPRHP
jgi:hypothetical protein